MYHYAGNNPVRYIDPDGRETKKTYSWVWLKGFRTTNDNGTGRNINDDKIVYEKINSAPFDISGTKFDSYDEAYRDAQKSANEYSDKRTGPPIKYNFDENNIDNNYMEVNLFIDLSPQGDGSTNEFYEVNRWIIVEEEQEL